MCNTSIYARRIKFVRSNCSQEFVQFSSFFFFSAYIIFLKENRMLAFLFYFLFFSFFSIIIVLFETSSDQFSISRASFCAPLFFHAVYHTSSAHLLSTRFLDRILSICLDGGIIFARVINWKVILEKLSSPVSLNNQLV